jgi:hypothetical protein
MDPSEVTWERKGLLTIHVAQLDRRENKGKARDHKRQRQGWNPLQAHTGLMGMAIFSLLSVEFLFDQVQGPALQGLSFSMCAISWCLFSLLKGMMGPKVPRLGQKEFRGLPLIMWAS